MRTWVKGTAPAALLALGVMSMGSGTAFADTSGDNSIGGGNQVNLPISLPIDISGNAAAVAGESTASSEGGASVENGGGNGIPGRTSGDGSVLGGNQVNAPISAPVNACGNALSVFGSSEAGCKGGASVKKSGGGGAGGNRTSGDHSIGGGNQVNAPISAPINLCGNSFAIFGEATAGCKGGASVASSGRGGAGGNRTSGRSSVLGGNQVTAPISAPVNICGNSIAVLGEAFSGCKGGAKVIDGGKPGRPGKPGYGGHGSRRGGHGGGHGPAGNDTDGRFGAGSGNQVIAPITAPINVCGNAVGNAKPDCEGGPSIVNPGTGGAGGNTTSGKHGVLAGNQVVAPIAAPINVCGNAVALIGKAFAGCKGGASVASSGRGGAGGNRTSGRSSVLGGNQVIAPITAPVNICGNAVAVLGDAAAGCLGGSHVGKPGHRPGGDHGRWNEKLGKQETRGLMPALPVADQAQDMAGLPELPSLPATPVSGKGPQSNGTSPLAPVTGMVPSTPVADALPIGDLGLMSAAQPAGVIGMNSGSLVALVLGAMAAASAMLFATTRRIRFGKK